MALTQNQLYVCLMSGLAGAAAASLLGRERTRIANLAVGGLFTALMAYYDPQNSALLTVLTAAVEGGTWGVADRLVPEVKQRLLHPGEEYVEAENEGAIPEPGTPLVEATAGWR